MHVIILNEKLNEVEVVAAAAAVPVVVAAAVAVNVGTSIEKHYEKY